MSGSGASVFAEFASRADAESILEKLAQEYAGSIDGYPIRGFAARGPEKHPQHHLAASCRRVEIIGESPSWLRPRILIKPCVVSNPSSPPPFLHEFITTL